MKYDLTIAYRIYPLISKVPAIYPNDKYKMSEICIKSFAKAIENINVKLYVILDNCPSEYMKLFKDNLKSDKIHIQFILTSGIGNGRTFGVQLTVLTNSDTEYVYFAEDDYFYLENSITDLLKFSKENKIDYSTPYDHLDYYNHKLHLDKSQKVKEFNGIKYYTQKTTTMTFMANREKLIKDFAVFKSYTDNNWDNSMWLSLTSNKLINPFEFMRLALSDSQMLKMYIKSFIHTPKQLFNFNKRELWVPKPGTATHLDNKFLGPNIDWELEFKKYTQE